VNSHVAAQRVLVVDDNAEMRDSLRSLLEHAGYDVALARDGGEALRVQRERPAEVLLTDIFMPEREGLETIQAFRSGYPAIGIIAMSGEAQIRVVNDYLTVARVAGADATLRKPFTAAALLAELRRFSPRAAAG
jgi:CheY-like chemotaxis protein